MAHHIYTTDAYVLDSQLSGEADRFFTLFTRDLGVIRATAKGIRLQKSKLRYSLQDLSLAKVSLVRGKEVWRITSARGEHNLYTQYKDTKSVIHLIAQVAALIRRLVGGEEQNQTLFEIVENTFTFLGQRSFSDQELKYIEIITVLRILNNLGYLRHVQEFLQFLNEPLSDSLIQQVEPHKASALKEINTSLRETQL